MSRSSSSWRVFQIAEWKAIDPEIDASNCKWFYEGNTIEEACAAMAADTESGAYELDAAAVQATVDCYNELCAKGSDDDFGKNPTFMRATAAPLPRTLPTRARHPAGSRSLTTMKADS